jgi:hypothetical protein
MVIVRRVVAYSMYTKPKFDHIPRSHVCMVSAVGGRGPLAKSFGLQSHYNPHLPRRESRDSSHAPHHHQLPRNCSLSMGIEHMSSDVCESSNIPALRGSFRASVRDAYLHALTRCHWKRSTAEPPSGRYDRAFLLVRSVVYLESTCSTDQAERGGVYILPRPLQCGLYQPLSTPIADCQALPTCSIETP